MALEPPRIGSPPPEQPEVPILDRLIRSNKRAKVIIDLQREITETMQMVSIGGQDAVKKLNVDGEPLLTEEQFEAFCGGLERMVNKLIEVRAELQGVIQGLTEAIGRLPSNDWRTQL
jgi:hypothetical protein